MIERIDSAVFGPVPSFVRLSGWAVGLDGTAPAASAARDELARASAAAVARDDLEAAWRAAYADVGLPPATVPPPAALRAWAATARGVPSQGPLPDILNAVSLRHGVPTAAYDVAAIVGDLWLRPSRGCEGFTPLGAADGRPETVPINELILVDSGDRTLARSWHGAPGAQAFVAPGCRAALVHVDLLTPDGGTPPDAAALAAEVADAVARHLGGRLAWQRLTRAAPLARWDG